MGWSYWKPALIRRMRMLATVGLVSCLAGVPLLLTEDVFSPVIGTVAMLLVLVVGGHGMAAWSAEVYGTVWARGGCDDPLSVASDEGGEAPRF